MEEDIKILRELEKNANIENADMNDCFGGEHIEAIENVLKELELAKEALKDKCEIADERNQLLVENQKLNKIIDKMIKSIVCDKQALSRICIHTINKTDEECEEQNLLCDDCIKEYFYKKAEAQE